nr:MAG TPA: hypothetical protein [Caudoviricetes sp.]
MSNCKKEGSLTAALPFTKQASAGFLPRRLGPIFHTIIIPLINVPFRAKVRQLYSGG